MLKCFYIDLVERISSEKKVENFFCSSKFEYSEAPLGDVLGTSLECQIKRSLGRSQVVRLGGSGDVRSGHPRDGEIGSLRDVLIMLEGDVRHELQKKD